MIRPIVIHPDPILRQLSVPLAVVTDQTRALLDDMLVTMYAASGRGLAAVQIGVLQRVVVIDMTWKEGIRAPLFLVNPVILRASDSVATHEERCLSLPGTPRAVTRPDRIVVRFLDRDGGEREVTADGWLSVALQHEIDHLDGVLILDHDVAPA